MAKYTYTEDMREISGFGGGYEQACRDMVVAGLEWCDKNVGADVSYDQFKNVYGLTTNESEDCKKMQQAMLDVANDCTGAMMQASMGHIMAIRRMGWDAYVEKMKELKNKE